MTYPTVYDLVHRYGAVKRTDAMHCMADVAELRLYLLTDCFDDLESTLRAKDRIRTLLHSARRAAFEARVHGFRLPG